MKDVLSCRLLLPRPTHGCVVGERRRFQSALNGAVLRRSDWVLALQRRFAHTAVGKIAMSSVVLGPVSARRAMSAEEGPGDGDDLHRRAFAVELGRGRGSLLLAFLVEELGEKDGTHSRLRIRRAGGSARTWALKALGSTTAPRSELGAKTCVFRGDPIRPVRGRARPLTGYRDLLVHSAKVRAGSTCGVLVGLREPCAPACAGTRVTSGLRPGGGALARATRRALGPPGNAPPRSDFPLESYAELAERAAKDARPAGEPCNDSPGSRWPTLDWVSELSDGVEVAVGCLHVRLAGAAGLERPTHRWPDGSTTSASDPETKARAPPPLGARRQRSGSDVAAPK